MNALLEKIAKKILSFEKAHDGDTRPHPSYAVYRRGESSQNWAGCLAPPTTTCCGEAVRSDNLIGGKEMNNMRAYEVRNLALPFMPSGCATTP